MIMTSMMTMMTIGMMTMMMNHFHSETAAVYKHLRLQENRHLVGQQLAQKLAQKLAQQLAQQLVQKVDHQEAHLKVHKGEVVIPHRLEQPLHEMALPHEIAHPLQLIQNLKKKAKVLRKFERRLSKLIYRFLKIISLSKTG